MNQVEMQTYLMKRGHSHSKTNGREFFDDSCKSSKRIFNSPLFLSAFFDLKRSSDSSKELRNQVRPETREIMTGYPTYRKCIRSNPRVW
jgi:hypothetical protein